jgi:D-glycero-D-manno-heptose 1,7-bisphosphate phosphatase
VSAAAPGAIPAGSRRAVFFDRDGVLNEAAVREGTPRPPAGPEELRIARGAPDALRALRGAGFFLVVVTNQPDVARGSQRRDIVEAINARLRAALPLDAIYVCYHDDRDACACRKPQPGLLLRAAAEHAIDLPKSFMIGDRWRDIEAGRRAGCLTIRLEQPYAQADPESAPDYQARSLPDAASWILARCAPAGGIL